jgi:hypothetical protein
MVFDKVMCCAFGHSQTKLQLVGVRDLVVLMYGDSLWKCACGRDLAIFLALAMLLTIRTSEYHTYSVTNYNCIGRFHVVFL